MWVCWVRGEFRLDVCGMVDGEMRTWQGVYFIVVCFDRVVARAWLRVFLGFWMEWWLRRVVLRNMREDVESSDQKMKMAGVVQWRRLSSCRGTASFYSLYKPPLLALCFLNSIHFKVSFLLSSNFCHNALLISPSSPLTSVQRGVCSRR